MEDRLDYHEIKYRLESHKTFRLFRKERVALMLAFFYEVFKKKNQADIPRSKLVSELDGLRDFLRISSEDETDKRDSTSFLDEWADEGYLRKFYRQDLDEASYDLTPESEKAIEWMRELSTRRFVGTESRLKNIFDLMEDIAFGAVYDAEERIAGLEKRKAEIDGEIARIRSGQDRGLDPSAVRERYYELEDIARRLLADFRQIERNFRELDRDAREKVIASDSERGLVLKDIFDYRDAIMASDQGKSFEAFWHFVMSSGKRAEFSNLADRVFELPEVKSLPKNFDLKAFDRLLLSAAAKVQRTAQMLSEELRIFLDDKSRSESKVVMDLAQEIKKLALSLKEHPPKEQNFISIEGNPQIYSAMERPLFTPSQPVRIAKIEIEEGLSTADASLIFAQEEIDTEAIRANIQKALALKSQASLEEILAINPITAGSRELLAYFGEASIPNKALIDDEDKKSIDIANTRRGKKYRTESPSVLFIKDGKR